MNDAEFRRRWPVAPTGWTYDAWREYMTGMLSAGATPTPAMVTDPNGRAVPVMLKPGCGGSITFSKPD